MQIIITESGINAEKVKSSSFINENYLQEYLEKNPDIIPMDEIREDIKLLILIREFPTDHGPIDVFAIDEEGKIYIIETKLYKNQDKRHVVAQILDYGAALNKLSINDFIDNIKEKARKDYPVLQDDLIQKIEKQHSDGSFNFVIIMDKVDDELKDLIEFINTSSNFKLYLIELEYYRYKNFEITIPKLYGKVAKERTGSRTKIIPEDFFNQLKQNTNEEIVEFAKQIMADCKKIGYDIDWKQESYIVKLLGPKGSGAKIPLFYVSKRGLIYLDHTTKPLIELGLDENIAYQYVSDTAKLFDGLEVHPIYKHSWNKEIELSDLKPVYDQFIVRVGKFVADINEKYKKSTS